jgi:hypothetical protein
LMCSSKSSENHHQAIKAENHECSRNSRLESRNHGLSERPLLKRPLIRGD